MPRKSKPPRQPYNTGGPSGNAPETPSVQPPRAATGQPYGQRGAMLADQEAVPLPGPSPMPAPVADPLADAQGMAFSPVPMRGPSNRPLEPVTAGLPGGPGPGPDALMSRRSSIAEVFDSIANATGNAYFAHLAQQARQRG